MRLIHLGFGNYIAAARVLGVAPPGAAPLKRLVRATRQRDEVIDLTSGRRMRSIIFLDNGAIALAAASTEILAERLRAVREESGI